MNLDWTTVLFYSFASWSILAALLTVFARNAARAALFLVWAFFSFASMWILLEAEFLAIILILVYIGAVMVLFLFVIKMLNIDKSTMRAKFAGYLPLGIFVAAAVVIQMIMVFTLPYFDMEQPVQSPGYSNITELATLLYTEYVLAFELAAVILLVAIVAAITLVNREMTNTYKQDIDEQVQTTAKSRLRIVHYNKNSSKEESP